MKFVNLVIILNVALILIAGFLLEHEDSIKQRIRKRKLKKFKKGN